MNGTRDVHLDHERDGYMNQREIPVVRTATKKVPETPSNWRSRWPKTARSRRSRFNGGRPPDEISFGTLRVSNFRRTAPPQTVLGSEQVSQIFRWHVCVA